MRTAIEGVVLVLGAVSTALAIAGVAIALLLNPVWVGFEQSRTEVTDLTGYTSRQVQEVTGSILADLVFGPPDFDVEVDGAPVLSERERNHMVDVRGAFGLAGMVVAGGCALLVVLGLVTRGSRRFWRAVRAGGLLAIGVVTLAGSLCVVFFDQAFELMHTIFFKSGTYTFDPRTDRLVQLFPDQFWFESGVALGVAIVVIAAIAVVVGGRLAGPQSQADAGTQP